MPESLAEEILNKYQHIRFLLKLKGLVKDLYRNNIVQNLAGWPVKAMTLYLLYKTFVDLMHLLSPSRIFVKVRLQWVHFEIYSVPANSISLGNTR